MCAGKEGSSEGEKRSCELALPPFHFPLLHPLLAAQATLSLFWSFLDPLPRPPVRERSIAQKSWAAREKRDLEDPPTQLHSKLSEEGGGKSEGKEGECYRKYIAGNASRT